MKPSHAAIEALQIAVVAALIGQVERLAGPDTVRQIARVVAEGLKLVAPAFMRKRPSVPPATQRLPPSSIEAVGAEEADAPV